MDNNSNNKNESSEEIDLGQLFNSIGRLFERFYNFILSIFKFFFSIFIYASKAIINNFKVIAIAMLISAVLGYFLERNQRAKFDSSMLLRTHFDTKHQLITNIQYYNALLDEENYGALSEAFKIEEKEAKELIEFEIGLGPEDENEKVRQYDAFIKSIDSVRAQEISFDDYIENRGIADRNLFEIKVLSYKQNIFKDLEEGISESLNNVYAQQNKKKRDATIDIRKQSILNSIVEIDSLQQVYITVLENESESIKATVKLGDALPLQQEKSVTKEFELLTKEIELREELRELEEEKVQEDVFYEVVSGFQDVGNKVSSIKEKYSLVFPGLSFLILCLGFLTKNFVRYAKNYKG